jgi:hypothetical protein
VLPLAADVFIVVFFGVAEITDMTKDIARHYPRRECRCGQEKHGLRRKVNEPLAEHVLAGEPTPAGICTPGLCR